MNSELEPQSSSSSGFISWVATGLWAAAGLTAAHIIQLCLEYFVFNPGDHASQTARNDRILGLTPWGLASFFAILLLVSIVRPKGRAGWARFGKVLSHFGRTVKGIRPRTPFTSHRSRTAEAVARKTAERAKYDEGFAARSAEIELEREDARRRPPSFRVEKLPRWHKNEFTLDNRGWAVSDVRLNAPEDEFIFDGDPPVWPGAFGDNDLGGSVGKGFYGDVTEKGLDNGVTFTISWSWQNRDREEQKLWVSPDRLILPQTTNTETSAVQNDAK